MNRSRVVTAALVLPAVALLGGCGDPGGLRSAGSTPTAVGPTHLWPGLPSPSGSGIEYDEPTSEVVKGIKVPGGDLHKVSAADIVEAQAKADPDDYTGPHALYKETADALKYCGSDDADDRKKCPVLESYYRDLTGEGKDDLIVGIRMPDDLLGIRVYAMDHGKLTQIMGTSDVVLGVELAGHDLVIRAGAGNPGYEYRTVWSWDPGRRAMLPTRDEIVRPSASPSPSPGKAKHPVPVPSPSATPDAGGAP